LFVKKLDLSRFLPPFSAPAVFCPLSRFLPQPLLPLPPFLPGELGPGVHHAMHLPIWQIHSMAEMGYLAAWQKRLK